jgi:hypothetical protein
MNGGSLLAAAGICAGLILSGCASDRPPDASADGTSLVAQATATVRALKTDSPDDASVLLCQAKAVVIFPNLLASGSAFAAPRGQGVLIARGQLGTWSFPAFYETASVPPHLALGTKQVSVVMFLMTDRAFQSVVDSNTLSLSAFDDLSWADLNTATEEQIAHDDIVVWSRPNRAFAAPRMPEGADAQRLATDRSEDAASVKTLRRAPEPVSDEDAAALRDALGP